MVFKDSNLFCYGNCFLLFIINFCNPLGGATNGLLTADKINHQLDHYFLIIGVALGHQQCQCH